MRGDNTKQEGLNDHLPADRSKGLFTVFHIDPALSDEIFIDEIAAETEAEARSLIKHYFAGHTILIVRKQTHENNQGEKADAYPNARFINGEFRASPVA
ncbi:MAG: hypothetical protein HOB79_17765 [Rhodospirillaceae bacterium]|nr:hypothetical protein [Rhodospirillaceae bacterium]